MTDADAPNRPTGKTQEDSAAALIQESHEQLRARDRKSSARSGIGVAVVTAIGAALSAGISILSETADPGGRITVILIVVLAVTVGGVILAAVVFGVRLLWNMHIDRREARRAGQFGRIRPSLEFLEIAISKQRRSIRSELTRD